jgi:endonuclease/exonuclease/phosphatase family metal-dependent hydrolase
VDAWGIAHPGTAQPPGFGLFDKQFASEPYCCDFVFVTPELAPRIASVRIDQETQASDHQPVIVSLA